MVTMVSHGIPWYPMEYSHGIFPWYIPMVYSHGIFPWYPMVSHGIPWYPMVRFVSFISFGFIRALVSVFYVPNRPRYIDTSDNEPRQVVENVSNSRFNKLVGRFYIFVISCVSESTQPENQNLIIIFHRFYIWWSAGWGRIIWQNRLPLSLWSPWGFFLGNPVWTHIDPHRPTWTHIDPHRST